MDRRSLGTSMVTNPKPLRPLSINRGVYRGIAAKTMPAVPLRVPERVVASDGVGPTEGPGPAETHEDGVYVALIVPNPQFASFSKWVAGNIRVVGTNDVDVHIIVLPEMDGDVDFDQYRKPASLTIGKSVPR